MTNSSHHLSVRSRLATAAGGAARFASRALGRGSGGMIGGEVALRISPKLLEELAAPFSSVIVTGTNGKSTTTRMVRAALESAGPVASNINGDNMTSGVLTALMQGKKATRAALEVDEMHVPGVAADVDPSVFVYLNLSRDQLDRVGEIGTVERRLRDGASAHPTRCSSRPPPTIRTLCGLRPVVDGAGTPQRIRAVGASCALERTGT